MNSAPVHLDPSIPFKKKRTKDFSHIPEVGLSPKHLPLFLGNLRCKKEEMQGSEAPQLQHFAVRLFSCQELMVERRQSRSAVRNIPRG